MTEQISFARKLIKGRIAEVIFDQMMRQGRHFTVIPFGYEHTVPTLAQYQDLVTVKTVMNNIKDAPDFLLISEDKKDIRLVEVKYRSHPQADEVLSSAKKLSDRWGEAWLFLATPKGFACAKCGDIVSSGGQMRGLSEEWASKSMQQDFLKLLMEFEKDSQE